MTFCEFVNDPMIKGYTQYYYDIIDKIYYRVACSYYVEIVFPYAKELEEISGSAQSYYVDLWYCIMNDLLFTVLTREMLETYSKIDEILFTAYKEFYFPTETNLLVSSINISSELFLIFALFIIFCYSLINSKSRKYLYPLMQINTIYLCILTILLTLFLLNNQLSYINNGTEIVNIITLFQNHFNQNSFFLILKEFLLSIILIVFLLSLTYTRYNNNVSYEFSLLLLLSTWAMCLLISSTDLISIYLVIELQSFCFYILTATKSHSNFSTEAGLKYFILGSFSSGLLLFGISILYGFTGLTNLDELKLLFFNLDLFNFNNDINFIAIHFALILILIGILFKFGLVPFHMYIPDVYTGAPSIVTVLFLVIQKFVILIVYMNLYNTLYINYFNSLNYFLIFSIIASISLGSVTALAQSKTKRLIAYSAIVNGGYLLLGVVIGTLDGLSSSFLFLFIYIILILTLFTIYLTTKNNYNNNKLANFKNFILMKKGNITLALSFSLILFSIAGIPPLAGFYGKLFLFTSVIKEGSYFLAIIAILFTVVTAYYYIRLIKIMFFEKNLKFGFFQSVNKIDAYIISIGTIFNIVFFLMPKLIFIFLNKLLLQFYFFW
jgi:proton-translocating NADH-quinone oxidoreductase chain N